MVELGSRGGEMPLGRGTNVVEVIGWSVGLLLWYLFPYTLVRVSFVYMCMREVICCDIAIFIKEKTANSFRRNTEAFQGMA
jgi:hypothetical protein